MRRAIALLVFCIAVTTMAASQLLTTVVSFAGPNGSTPTAPVIKARDANLYGTTSLGGASQGFGDGTVFKITSQGAFSSLYSFQGADGENPYAGLVQATDGNFYGTTVFGGSNGHGNIFKITPEGTLTTIYSFGFSDGYRPYAGLIQAIDGNLYGTTTGGGANGAGTVFKITLDGTLTTLHSFNLQDGAMPTGALVQGADGSFYGTTEYGGPMNGGTVFRMTPQGDLITLYSFANGVLPYAGLVQASDGNFYGTTYYGGANYCGTVFRITPTGRLTTLHSFDCNEGWYASGLMQGINHNLYGTTMYGGNLQACIQGCGTIFEIGLDGTFNTLYNFNGTDGAAPAASLYEFEAGLFYGTTSSGGSSGDGTVFRFVVSALLSVAKSGMGTITSGDGYIYCGSLCAHKYAGGAQVGLTAIPAPGYTFTNWAGCNNVNGSFCSVLMDIGKNAIATFQVANVGLTSLVLNPSSVKGGNISIATITLNAPAPPGGLGVGVTSDHPLVVHPPPLVTVPGGMSSFSFAVRTSVVRSTTVANVTASANASQVSATLTVSPTYESLR
jgi:uncharacterized repeat protein (TIGR03803 family)